MTKFKKEYKEIVKVKGDFFSDFITNRSKNLLGEYITTFKLVGRHKFSNLKVVTSFPKSLDNDKYVFKHDSELKEVEIYPLKNQKKPIEKEKRLSINNLIINDPKIDDYFYDDGVKKGQLIGVAYASIGEWVDVPIPEKKLPPKKVDIKKETDKTIDPVKKVELDKSHLINTPASTKKGCMSRKSSTTSTSSSIKYDSDKDLNDIHGSSNSGVRDNNNVSGIGSMLPGGCANRMPGGCGSFGSGCLPSWAMGCQRIGCGLLSFLLLLALLLWLLRECNNATSTNNDEKAYDEVRVDTVRVYETDTVETVILDTLFSVDTIQLTDTMYTVIKNALPLPNVLFKSNSAIIRASSLEGIKSLGDSLNAHTDINMIIAGHTDASGDNYHNDSLSFCRAKAVRDVLVDSCGISADRLMFEGYGENCPIEDNKSIEGKTTNRRVEFRYFGESIGKCEEFKIQIDEDVCNSGSYLSSVETPKFTKDTILNHKIKHHETLYSISKKYNVSIDELINLNPGVENGLITGQVIKVPISAFVKPTQSDESVINAEWYTIKDKDGYVNVRSGRNIASRILYRIRVSQQFQVVDQTHNKWWKIIFKNTEGFIHSSRVIKVESNNE